MSTEQPAGKPGILTLIKAAAVIAVVVVAECVAAAMLLPNAKDTEELGRKIAEAEKNDASADDQQASNENVAQEDIREVSLGAYHVTSFQPESNTTLRIDLTLFGTVLADEVSDFDQLYAMNQHRISEQVHATLRGAEITDLADAGLGLIKRSILEKSNRTIGKPLLRDVVFSEFSFMEQ